ncbi:40S ribosomal protein S29 [Trichonephila inaurata madagascariensis]|uniref:Small ribosomal subunit protein uS14 n=1 Tax=Trichonephila inaurata madagascariensis TaxID=2747483 RepID=A0A8X6YNN7_9ARAC|nr:40S ribosomal protein S29 [Trichonephila inaurata madagascariensis]
MGHKNLWFSHPRKFGPGSRTCRVCSNHHGLILKYGLNMCRRCFRENAADIGFKKVTCLSCYPDIVTLHVFRIRFHYRFVCCLNESLWLGNNINECFHKTASMTIKSSFNNKRSGSYQGALFTRSHDSPETPTGQG